MSGWFARRGPLTSAPGQKPTKRVKNVTNAVVAFALGAAIAAPTFAAGGLTAEQIAEERSNLHSDGSLPFVHAAKFYGSGVDNTIWTEERIAEFQNLHSEGSLLQARSSPLVGL